MLEALTLLIRLRDAKMSLWTADGKLKFVANDEAIFNQFKSEIVNLKPELVRLLEANQVFSEADFKRKPILSTSTIEHPPLSFAQERLWFIEQYEKGTTAYNIPILLKLAKQVKIDLLKTALTHCIEHHAILKTIFRKDDSGLTYQQFNNVLPPYNDITVDEDNIENMISRSANKPFDLESNGPIAATFLHPTKKDMPPQLLIVFHHIASDGWSSNIFLRDLTTIYDNLIDGRHYRHNLPKVEIDYKDYALWQRLYLTENRLERQLSFWKNKLADFENLSLPLDKQRPATLDYQGAAIDFFIDSDTSLALKAIASQQNCSLYCVMLAAFYIFLYHATGQQDLVVGSPIANRHHGQTQNLIGFFVNSLALREKLDINGEATHLIQQISDNVALYQQYQDLPFEKLVEELGLEKDMSRHPIFQVLFSVQSFFDNMNTQHFCAEFLPEATASARFDLELLIDDSNEAFHCHLNYATSVFEQETILRFANYFQQVLKQLVKKPHGIVKEFSLLSQKERDTILYEWGRNDYDFPKQQTIIELFEKQATLTPNEVCLVFENQEITYQTLNTKANQLAHYLNETYSTQQQKSLTADTLIALCVNRSVEMVVAILAVMKLGAAYVPIDASYPNERIAFILQDTSAQLLLTQSHLENQLSELSQANSLDINLVLLDKLSNTEFSESNLNRDILPNHLAYVIYTSGTTGKPKGVLIEHEGLVNYCRAQHAYFDNPHHNRIYLLHSFAFDTSISTLFLSLCFNNILFLTKESERLNIDNFKKFKVNLAYIPPALLSTLKVNELGTLDTIIVSGETTDLTVLQALADKTIINEYGPTEATIGATQYTFDKNNLNQRNIGKPIYNKSLYVLDNQMKPVPVGITGELYIGGLGLARGYLNQATLTSERFVENPYATDKDKAKGNTRLYKTGDLVRWLTSGNLEYLGRNDCQVKIHGFRIELGEIETCLLHHEDIEQVAVITKTKQNSTDTTDKQLIAYYVSQQNIPNNQLHQYLTQYLPNYMIPNGFVHMDSLPLTINGKLDTKALPEPVFTRHEETYQSPTNELEEKLCMIWQALLGNERISIDDDFFHLGGHSILAIQLVNRINLKLNTHISIKDIFQFRTIKALARLIDSIDVNFKYQDYLINVNARSNEENTPFPLTNVQQAYLYGRLENFELGGVSTHLYVEFIFNTLDVARLQYTFNQLLQRHEALRTIFQANQQLIIDAKDYSIKNHGSIDECALEDIRERLSHKIYPVDCYPLFDLEVSQYKQQQIMHFSMDALLMDGPSIGLFLQEWANLYNYKKDLPAITLSFRDYMLTYTEIRESHLFTLAKQYWENRIADYQFEMNLPLQANPSAIKSPKFARINKIIDPLIWQSIVTKAEAINVSPTSVILTIYGLVLSYWSGQNQFCINLTLFNRLPLHDEVNTLVGDFTALELFNFVLNSRSISQQIQQVHDTLWEDLEYSLFDGLDVQRLIRKQFDLPQNRPIAPVVLTSVLGEKRNQTLFRGFDKIGYSITQTSQVYLDNKIYEDENGLIAEWDYVEQLFDADTISAMHSHYCHLIEQFAALDWSTDIPKLTLPEKHLAVIAKANHFTQAKPCDTLVTAFEKRVKSLEHHAVAVIDSHGEYTYRTLLEKSQAIAISLYKLNIGNGELVAILSEKSHLQVIATLGIMRAGLAYLPLHVDWPLGRIDDVLTEGQVTTIIASYKQYEKVATTALANQYRWLILEELKENTVDQTLLSHIAYPSLEDVAYVIFTSGSTGKPKGVTISHHGAINTINAVNQRFDINHQDKVLALSELSFDLSVYDIFGLLTAGGSIVFPEQEKIKNPAYWLELVKTYNINIWNTVPQLAQLLFDYANDQNITLPYFKTVLMSGDWIPLQLPDQIKQHNPQTTVMSLGGATEGSIWSIWYEFTELDTHWHAIPYGYAMPNQNMYVLNNAGEHCPLGVLGEIHIGGDGVAIDYRNNAEKTASSFFIHPELGRLYKTGDLGKWHKDGYIEFQGRQDKQVKLNGYRIELEEISAKLLELTLIDEAVVKVSDNTLLAYILTTDRQQLPTDNKWCLASPTLKSDIEQHLKNYLPDYMLPKHYLVLSELPLTSNGKLDTNALPLPELTVAGDSALPKTATELVLAMLWKEVLKLESDVAISHSFFDLGGNSLSAMVLLGKINTSFNVNFTLMDLFENFTIQHIANKIDRNSTTDWTPLITLNGHEKDKANLYILPGIIGCSSAYYSLASLLTKHFQVNIIEAKGLYGTEPPHHELDELLADYYRIILDNIDGDDILYFVAHSSGCIYACELAHKLRSNNINVEVLFIDGDLEEFDSMEEATGTSDADGLLLKAIQELYDLSSDNNTIADSTTSRLQQIANYLFADDTIDNHYKLQVAQGFSNVFRHQLDITVNYVPRDAYLGNGYYIAAEENQEKDKCIKSFSDKFSGTFQATISSGGHLTMLTKTHVDELATKILKAFAVT